MYAKPHVREGLLGRMLVELLDTRVMVKQAMKAVKSDKAHLNSFQSSAVFTKLPIGPNSRSQRAPTGIEVYRKCHLWVYWRDLFWSHASGRDCR